MIFWVAAASIAAIVAAGAGIASAIIYWMTFKSVNAQTGISQGQADLARSQFEIARSQFNDASKRFEESFVPWTTLRIGKYNPATWAAGINGRLTVTVSNEGVKPFRLLRLTIVHDGTTIALKDRGELIVPAGTSRDVTGAFYVEPLKEWSRAETTTEIEAANGKRFRHFSSWTLRHRDGANHELEDERVEEVKS
jgi:hypothetical protein